MSLDKDLLEEILVYVLNNDLLTHIFKDLIWGIIRYKGENWEDSSERLRGFIEHSHKALYEELIKLTSNPIHLEYYEKSAKNLYEKLRWYIFWDLSINETNLLDETRKIYKDLALHFHEIISNGSKSEFLLIIAACIKLMFLVKEVIFLLEKNQKKKLKSININENHGIFFTLKNDEILETFIHMVFSSRKVRDLIFRKSILDMSDISNSRFLQSYLPYYNFNHWKIENLLSEKTPNPFRPVGPHLIDFKKGNWVSFPKIAKLVVKNLEKHRKSILISATSGTGKTVISRLIGYTFHIKGFNVFYIDCLKRNAKNIETVIDQIIIHHESGAKKLLNVLFIFENVHSLDNELRLKLNKCKDTTLCLLTERIFEEKREKKESVEVFRQNFDLFQRIEISLNHWTFRNTIKGIITLNTKSRQILNQIEYIGNQNLWIYAIILKLLKNSLEMKQDSSIIDIFTDQHLIGEKITEYFEDLLKIKAFKLNSSEFDLYLNHIHYFMGILSLFSEYELWTERRFIDHLLSIKDGTPIGVLNSEININKKILTEIQSFLIDIFEISNRTVDLKPGIKELEFKIPHSQMAIIYKNCILRKFEKSYPGLIEQLNFLYVSFTKYYGSFLQQKHSYLIREGNIRNFEVINKQFFNFDSYLLFINYFDNQEILQNQIINNSIEESSLFFSYVSMYDDQLKRGLFKNLFQDKSILFDHSWKSKIIECKPSNLYVLLKRINTSLGDSSFIDFLGKFKHEIFKKFKEDKGDYIFSFLNLLLPLNDILWLEFLDNISDLIDQTSIKMKDLFSIYIRNKEFFGNINKEHKFYSMVKKVMKNLILKINFEEERQFVPSPYYNYGDFFSQIYYEILEELLTQPDQALKKAYDKKLRNTNLTIIIQYLEKLYEHNPSIAIRFFKKFLGVIKNKLYQADVDNIVDFFDVLRTFAKEKDFIKSTFLFDWDWFIGIFLRLSNSEFFYFSKFRIINFFFEDLFPEYLEKYNKFFIHESKLRIQEYYENLDCKLDIVDRLNEILGDELNEFILNLFNKSIYDSLKTQSLSFHIKTFSKLNLSYSLKENWDFKEFILSKDFKEKLMLAKDTKLKEFFNIFRKGEPWREILFDNYKELLINRFGQNYEIIMKLDEGSQEFIDHLKANVNDFDIVEIIKHYNNYSDPFFGEKESYFFLQLRETIQDNYDKFFNAEFKSKLSSLDFTGFFYLIIILKVYHPSILKEFCIRNKSIILDILNRLNDNSDEILEVIMILEFYKLKLDILKELDRLVTGDISLYDVVLETLKKIDLASLRYLIQINPVGFLNEYTKIEFFNHLEHSSLLQLSIFLYKFELNIALKIPGHMYIRKMSFMGGPVQKSPFVLELSEEDLKELKAKIKSVLWLEDRFLNPKRERFSYLHHSDLITEIISAQFTPFSPKIIDLIKQSNVWEIALYFKSLTKIFTDIEQNRFEIPEKLEKYLISEKFKNKINKAEFYHIYRLFKYLKMIKFSLSREIWMKNRILFEDEAFPHKLRNSYTYRIFRFYDMFNYEHFKFSTESIDILKKIMRLRPLETSISFFLEISSNDDFNALISVFKEEIIDIAKKYSKFELKKILSKIFMREYNPNSLLLMRSIFQERMNEKYFFEQ